jgi:hypothetical protein
LLVGGRDWEFRLDGLRQGTDRGSGGGFVPGQGLRDRQNADRGLLHTARDGGDEHREPHAWKNWSCAGCNVHAGAYGEIYFGRSRRLRLSHLDRCILACNHQEIMGRLISACRWGPRAVSFPIILTGRTQGRTEPCEGAQLLTMSGLVEAGAAPPFATRYGSVISRKSARDKNRSTRVRYIYIHIHIIDFFRIFQFSHIKL